MISLFHRSRFLVLLVALALGAGACTDTHASPQEGTETGNPPVLDSNLIALVVSANEVHIVGSKGAVRPGGTQVEVTSIDTGRVARAKSLADGSFDIVLEASELETFSVRAIDGNQTSQRVSVTRGGAKVVAEGQALSCSQQEQEARSRLQIAAAEADKSCTRDDDCVRAFATSNCNDDCGGWIVSLAGSAQLQLTRGDVEASLCANFRNSGCTKLALPCAPPTGEPVCVSGQCQVSGDSLPQMRDCTSSFTQAFGSPVQKVWWFSTEANYCLPRDYSGSGGNANRYATRVACEEACPQANKCAGGRSITYSCLMTASDTECSEGAALCARLCTRDADCTGDPVGSYCNGAGFCSPVHN